MVGLSSATLRLFRHIDVFCTTMPLSAASLLVAAAVSAVSLMLSKMDADTCTCHDLPVLRHVCTVLTKWTAA